MFSPLRIDEGVVNLDDSKILEMFYKRQEAAIDETRRKYGTHLYRTAMNILHSKEDAEECVNDTLLKAWESIPPVRPIYFGAYLVKITRNLSLHRWEARGAAKRGGGKVNLLLSELEESIPSSGGPEEAYESELISAAIRNCLSDMKQTARVAFILRYFHGESIQAISQRFQMSESKVKSILFRARKKLNAYLEKEGVML